MVKTKMRPVWRKAVCGQALLFFLLFVLFEAIRVGLGSNFHVVAAGQCFRCAQPSATSLTAMAQAQGIRTIINLRGINADQPWYQQETITARHLGLNQVDVNMSSYPQPKTPEFRKLVQALVNMPEPILLHCQRGGDRSGLAAACYLLLRTPTSLDAARAQLCLRYGHNIFGSPVCLGHVLDQYADWLACKGLRHQSAHFYSWALHDYHPDYSVYFLRNFESRSASPKGFPR